MTDANNNEALEQTFREILQAERYGSQAEIAQALSEKGFQNNKHLIVMHTSPGSAQMIARMLDSIRKSEGILGTIAGDDTIFIAPKNENEIEELTQAIAEMFLENDRALAD